MTKDELERLEKGHSETCLIEKPFKSMVDGRRTPYCNCGYQQFLGRMVNKRKYWLY